MFKILILTLLLLIPATCLRAASASPSSDKNQKSSDLTTVQGCLSLARGQYNLVESDGTEHQLSGAAKQLGPHVGHEVELTGKLGIRTVDTTSVGGGSSAIQLPIFEVKDVKHVADSCKPAAH